MIATGNYPQAVMDNVHGESRIRHSKQIAIFQEPVQVQQDALLVVERQDELHAPAALCPYAQPLPEQLSLRREFTVND
ncbi:hypothetical protein MJ391_00320 [Escherichia coli]|nr:hypothetical protein MJ391_00320 [Escherichia coli]